MTPTLCPLRALTGLDCPLCGASRATVDLLSGDLGQALDHNALYVLVLPFVLAVVGLWVWRRRWPAVMASERFVWGALGAAVAWGVVRNVPWAPLAVLGS